MTRRGRVPALALDDLEAWLAAQPDIARRNWTVSSIDGFCAALVAGPERIATEAWLRVIFGPSLPTTPVGLGALQAVLEHHDAVSHMLHFDGGRRWRPLYMRDDDGTVSANPWAAGFMFAVRRWPDAWRPMLERGDHAMLMLPIITCAEVEEVEKLLDGQPQEMRDHMGRAYHHIPEAVCAIRDYWRERAEQRNSTT
jgi:yecA family protein